MSTQGDLTLLIGTLVGMSKEARTRRERRRIKRLIADLCIVSHALRSLEKAKRDRAGLSA